MNVWIERERAAMVIFVCRKGDVYKIFEVEKVFDEGSKVKTLVLNGTLDAKPGQFVMVWEPGVGEKPFGVGSTDPLAISIGKVGKTSAALHEKKPGDRVWLRGPYGNGFTIRGKNIACVAGGYGVSPIRFLAKKAREAGAKVCVFMGARTKKELMLKPNGEAVICTDDGSCGEKGFATQAFEQSLKQKKYDAVYTCGPEMMMKKVVDACIARGIPCQASLDRFMKCGLGICGSCAIDGLLACKDGPVFEGEAIAKMKEFGTISRDASGKKVKI